MLRLLLVLALLLPAAAPGVASAQAMGGGSYEVKKGDTLAGIARQYRPDGASLNQMLIALQRENEDAFIRKNVNLVQAGRILRIPAREVVMAVDAADADRMVGAQMAEYAAYRGRPGRVAAPAPTPAPVAPVARAAPAVAVAPVQPQVAKATFAAGCFWCTEEAFDKVPGVVETVSGYMGGKAKNPTYEQVSSGGTGHTEVLQVTYDPSKVSYEKLLEVFWINHDPTVTDRQFCDRGSQYRPGIFTHDAEQQRLAEASKAKWEKDKPFRQPILTPIVPASEFWKAEDYHQDYHLKNPVRYRFYSTGCGRYSRLDELWGKYRNK